MLPVRDACAEKSLQKKSSNINTESNTAGSHYAGETQVSASLTSECLSMPVYSLLITPQGINSACLTENAFSAHSLCLVSFFFIWHCSIRNVSLTVRDSTSETMEVSIKQTPRSRSYHTNAQKQDGLE